MLYREFPLPSWQPPTLGVPYLTRLIGINSRRPEPAFGLLQWRRGDCPRAVTVMANLWGRAPEFDQTVESFQCFVRRLEQYFIACDVPEDNSVKRRAILLSVLRPQCYGLLEDLVSPRKPSDCKYKDLVDVLANHFEPAESVIVERFRFHSCCRVDGESVAEFLARLRCLAKRCSFSPDTLEDNLRDRFVCGIGDNRLQTRLLGQSDLTLASAVSLARAFESAEAQAKEIARSTVQSAAVTAGAAAGGMVRVPGLVTSI